MIDLFKFAIKTYIENLAIVLCLFVMFVMIRLNQFYLLLIDYHIKPFDKIFILNIVYMLLVWLQISKCLLIFWLILLSKDELSIIQLNMNSDVIAVAGNTLLILIVVSLRPQM